MTSARATKWDKTTFRERTRISDQGKQEIADYLRAGLKMGKSRDELLEELAKKYDRSSRTIERYIAQCSPSEKQIYRKGAVATTAGQGRLFSIELPRRQAILHQLRVIGSESCVFTVMVCESANDPIDAMHSNIGIFQSHGRVVQETFRLPDWYYEDKEGGTHLHLEIIPLIDQYLKPQTPVDFEVGVWFTSVSR